ncbi:DUF6059 family protein [Streptomyces sp. GD-15H]|uniref:DUF6059 family protein n=1 Tax=Streptomyces sp. GD-15H TaxID=3129112 RepID=UPI0032452437
MFPALRRLAGAFWYSLQCVGTTWVNIPGWVPEPPERPTAVESAGQLAGPAPGHPERMASDLPMSAEELLLWQRLGAHW